MPELIGHRGYSGHEQGEQGYPRPRYNRGAPSMGRALLIGHRGYSALYPENTMLSFKKAIEVGCTGIELDVRLSKDNRVVVIHDKNLERTTNGEGLVSEYTLKELKKLDAGRGEKIPTLEEVLDKIKDIKLLIELKEDSEKICTEVIRLAGRRENTFFISFSLDAIRNVKNINSQFKTGLIFSKPIIEPERYAKFLNALCPRLDRLDSKVAAFAKQYKLETYVWTVNTPEDLKSVKQYNVTGIVTNDPERIGKLL